jgi:hypothetical protein
VVEVLSSEGVGKAVLQIFLIFDAVLDDDIRDVVDGLRHTLELNFAHLNGFEQEAIQAVLKVLLLGEVLREDKFIHIFLNGVDGLQVILNIHEDFGDSLVDFCQLHANIPDLMLGLLPFSQNVIVAFVFFQFQRLDDQ